MITLSDLLYVFGGGVLLFVLCYLYRRNKMTHSQKFAARLIDKEGEHIEIPIGLKSAHDKTDPTLAELGFRTADPVLGEKIIDTTPSDTIFSRKRAPANTIADILVINVFAMPGHTFAGYELLQALLASNLRFGEMSVFHRYQEELEKPKILFSVASATEPGIFDLNSMGSYSCSGLSLFMRVDQTDQPQKVFDMMLATARQLADDLSGEIYDGNHEPLTKDSLSHYQQLLM